MPDQILSDQITLSDDSSQIGFGLSFSEKIGLFDAGNLGTNEIARILYTDLFQFQDSVGFSLNTITIIGIGFNPIDSLAISDTNKLTLGLLEPLSESFTLLDFAATRVQVGPISFLLRDSLNLLDSISTSIFYNSRAIFDSLNLADSSQYLCTAVTALADSTSLIDSIGLSQTSPSVDSISLSDTATITIGNLIINTAFNPTDSINLFDSIQLSASNRAISMGDFLNLQDPEIGAMLISTPNYYLRRYLNDVI